MSQKLKFLGVPVYLNGQNYYVPSLSTRDFKLNYEKLTTELPADTTFPQLFDHYAPIILLAVNRNYPDFTLEQLDEWSDSNTLKQLIAAVQGASRMTPVAEGE